MHLAIRGIETGKIIFLLGRGGDGKGMHSLLDKPALGS